MIDQGIKDALITLQKLADSKPTTEETSTTTDIENNENEFDRFIKEITKYPQKNKRILKIAKDNKII